jgi:hypothetical protein
MFGFFEGKHPDLDKEDPNRTETRIPGKKPEEIMPGEEMIDTPAHEQLIENKDKNTGEGMGMGAN